MEEYFVIVYFCCLKNYCIVDLCNCKMEMLINENEFKKMLNKYRFIFCFCVIMLYKMELMFKGY